MTELACIFEMSSAGISYAVKRGEGLVKDNGRSCIVQILATFIESRSKLRGINPNLQVKMTKEELAKEIYEVSFEFDGLFVKVDILHRGAQC